MIVRWNCDCNRLWQWKINWRKSESETDLLHKIYNEILKFWKNYKNKNCDVHKIVLARIRMGVTRKCKIYRLKTAIDSEFEEEILIEKQIE